MQYEVHTQSPTINSRFRAPICQTRYTKECQIAHKQWDKGGCTVNLPVSSGVRLRHQLDPKGETYKQVYAQRTAVERIFSQAVHWGHRTAETAQPTSHCQSQHTYLSADQFKSDATCSRQIGGTKR